MNLNDLKSEIMENRPIAKVNVDGDIELEINDKFYESLDNYCDEKKAEIKKRAFQVVMMSSLGLAISTIITKLDPSLVEPVLFSAKALLIGQGLYISDAINKSKEANFYKENIEDAFKKEAIERYNDGNYYDINSDGSIVFDEPSKKGGMR